MNTKDFFYELPQELIAQTPLEHRDNSRMLVLNKSDGEISHRHFYDILDYISPNDCLIINDSRVLPARIFGIKEGYEKPIEFLLLKQRSQNVWEAICKPGRKAKEGAVLDFGGIMRGEILDVLDDGNRIISFSFDSGTFFENLDKIGQMPLPPYITEKLNDKERYQTVYSRELGSAAAPTAGLHFTNELLKKISDKEVAVGKVTLHVGLGTFRPVKVSDVENHKMHSEYYEVPAATAELIKKTKQKGGRVFAVGTTTCRTLESVAAEFGEVVPTSGQTDIFIYPGFAFRAIDCLITNFHLPESTLIMLVSAFAGFENTMNAYKTAVDEKYRFFSFGDSMLII